MDIIYNAITALTTILLLVMLVLIIGAPVIALQYWICERWLHWPRWLLPAISIFFLFLSVWPLFDADFKEQAVALIYAQFGDYTGTLVIEGLLPFFGIVMFLSVMVGMVLHYLPKRSKRKQ